MKILHITDSHQNFPKNLPKADFLVHTGDYSLCRKYANLETRKRELIEFNLWLGTIKNNYKAIIFTPGNHDFIFETDPKLAEDTLDNATVLNDNGVIIEGVNFYGTPSQPEFCNWAFNHDLKTRTKYYARIPDTADILLTHCPPEEILDLVSMGSYSKGEHVGCPRLRYEVENRIKPKLHCFGHIHENNGVVEIKNIKYSNACIMDDRYDPTGSYNLIELEV